MPPNYRRCVSCRKLDHRSTFWRVVRLFPSHQLQLDQGMGRSVYLCQEATCLKLAQKKDRLGRSLKLAVPESFYQVLWQRLGDLATFGHTRSNVGPAELNSADSIASQLDSQLTNQPDAVAQNEPMRD